MAAPVAKELETSRNPVATSAGAGAALVLSWVWNDILAPLYGWPTMPEGVVVVISIFIVDLVRWILSTTATVIVPQPVPDVPPVVAVVQPPPQVAPHAPS